MGLKAVATLVSGGGAPVGGSGTPGKLAKFTGATTLGDSLLSESGTTITSAATAQTFSAAQTWTLPSSASALNIASNLLNIDTANSRVGVGTASPTKKLDVNGAANITGALTVAGSVSRISGQQMFVPPGSFTVVTIPENYKAFLVSSTTNANETLSSLHLIGSDTSTAQVAALSVFQTTVTNHGATPGLAQIRIFNNSGITATVKFSLLQIS